MYQDKLIIQQQKKFISYYNLIDMFYFTFRSPWENLCLILFIAGALYAVITVKDRASYLSTIDQLKDGNYRHNIGSKDYDSVGYSINKKALFHAGMRHVRFCRICQHNVPGKDHHCVWVDACISHTNIYPFIAFLVCIFLTLIHAGLLFLTSVCDHASLERSLLFSKKFLIY